MDNTQPIHGIRERVINNEVGFGKLVRAHSCNLDYQSIPGDIGGVVDLSLGQGSHVPSINSSVQDELSSHWEDWSDVNL